MGLGEILDVVLVQNIKDSIVTDGLVLKKSCLFFGWGNQRPKFMVGLATLSSPLSVPPRIPQLEDSNDIAFDILKLSGIDMN